MTTGLSTAEFGDLFDRFAASPTSRSVWRLESHQHYDIAADEPSLVAFRDGTPRPERSVRTSPWLARIATSTIAGKRWRRARVVVEPATEYVRWELLAYVESQAAGEEIRVLRCGSFHGPDDVWVFDGDDRDDRYAVIMHYQDGVPDVYELVTDPTAVRNQLQQVASVFGDATPLNHYLAHRREVTGAA